MIYTGSSGCTRIAELENALVFLSAFSNFSSAKENLRFSKGPFHGSLSFLILDNRQETSNWDFNVWVSKSGCFDDSILFF